MSATMSHDSVKPPDSASKSTTEIYSQDNVDQPYFSYSSGSEEEASIAGSEEEASIAVESEKNKSGNRFRDFFKKDKSNADLSRTADNEGEISINSKGSVFSRKPKPYEWVGRSLNLSRKDSKELNSELMHIEDFRVKVMPRVNKAWEKVHPALKKIFDALDTKMEPREKQLTAHILAVRGVKAHSSEIPAFDDLKYNIDEIPKAKEQLQDVRARLDDVARDVQNTIYQNPLDEHTSTSIREAIRATPRVITERVNEAGSLAKEFEAVRNEFIDKAGIVVNRFSQDLEYEALQRKKTEFANAAEQMEGKPARLSEAVGRKFQALVDRSQEETNNKLALIDQSIEARRSAAISTIEDGSGKSIQSSLDLLGVPEQVEARILAMLDDAYDSMSKR